MMVRSVIPIGSLEVHDFILWNSIHIGTGSERWMGMSSQRAPLHVLEAASARGLLPKQGRTYASTVAPKAYERPSSVDMTLVDGSTVSSVEQRLPSPRPINQRWDRSRGISLSNSNRNAVRDFRWSARDPIVFSETSAPSRDYSIRPLFGRRSAPANEEAQKDENDLVKNPNMLSARSIDRVEEISRQMQKANEANKKIIRSKDEQITAGEREAARLAQEIQQLKSDIAKPRVELKTKEDELKDKAADLEVLEGELKRKETEINSVIKLRTQELEEQWRKRNSQMEAHFEDRRARMKTHEADYDSKVARAWEQARLAASEEVEEVMRSAQKAASEAATRLREASDLHQRADLELRTTADNAQRQEERHEEAMKQVQQEVTVELQRHKDDVESELLNNFEEEMRLARKTGETREKLERYDYEAYHQVWDELFEAMVTLLSQSFSIWQLLRRASDTWARLTRKFDGREIHPLFPGKYKSLNDSLKHYLNSNSRESKSAVAAMKDHHFELQRSRNLLKSVSHVSRQLTRYHRMRETQNNQYTLRLVEQMLNENPLREYRGNIMENLRKIDLELKNTSNIGVKQSLEMDKKQLKRDEGLIGKFLDINVAYRQLEELKELKRASVFEKEIWQKTQEAHKNSFEADDQWRMVARENPYVSRKSAVGEEQQQIDRAEFLEKHRAVRQQTKDYEAFIRKRQLLQLHLGEIKEDDGRFDAEIEKQIAKAENKLERALMLAVSLRHGVSSSGSTITSRPLLKTPPRIVPKVAALRPAVSPRRSREGAPLPTAQVSTRIQSLRVKANKSQGRISKEEQQEIDELKLEYAQKMIEQLQSEKAELLRTSSADPKKLETIDKAIEESRRFLAKNAAQPDLKGPSPAPRSPKSRPIAPHRHRRARRLGRQAVIIPNTSTHATTLSASENNGAEQSSSTLNFSRTAPLQSRQYLYLGRLQWSHAENAIAQTLDASNAMSPSDDGNDAPGGVALHSHASQASSMPFSREVTEQRQLSFGSRDSSEAHQTSASTVLDYNDDSDYHPQSATESVSDPESNDTAYAPSDSEATSSSVPSEQFEDAVEDMPGAQSTDAPKFATQLTYEIPPEDYRKAVLSSKSTNAAFWTYKLYKNAQGETPKIHYCTNYHASETQASQFLNEPVLGFDIEWEYGASPEKSGIKNSVSLIQIASDNKIALFHVSLFKGETPEQLMPPSLRAILESPSIAKAGVNVSGDALRLEKCFGVKMVGLFELSHLYRVVVYSEGEPGKVNRKLLRLADQVQNILLLPLKKDDVRTSAWSKKLRMEQTEYAASDAYAGFRLYHALEAKRMKMNPVPPRPAFYEEHLPIQLRDGTVVVPKRYAPKRKREEVDGVLEEEDDECQEYFDAVETLETYQIDSQQTGGVPLLGIDVSYPTLPTLDLPKEPDPSAKMPSTQADPSTEAAAPAAASSSKATTKRSAPPTSIEVSSADTWAHTWRSSLPAEYKLKVSHATLRAYHLWHEQRFDCKEVAALLRDPPLSTQTVASYVMQALNEENLPFEDGRVREPLGILPKSVHGRYYRIVERIESAT